MSLEKTEQEFGKVDGSPMWIKKMRTLFRRLDYHGNCYLSLDDMLELASNIMSNFPNLPGHRGDEVVQASINLWFSHFSSNLPESERTGAHITEAHFIENIKKDVNGQLKEQFMDLFILPFFKAADGDEDGQVTIAEFKGLMRSFSVPEKDSELNFKLLDAGHKNKITTENFRCAMADYFFSDESKGKVKLFGPLVNYKRPEDYGAIGCGPYWETKMRTMFRRLDICATGRLTCNDFILIARGIAKRGHLDKKKSDAVMKAMLDIWVKYIAVDKSGRHFAEINEKEFVHNIRAMINDEFRHEIDQFGWTFFKAVETAHQGFLNMQEYRNLHESWRVTREEADAMFKVIDTDKDGKISHDEYLSAWIDYFLGEDPNSPYKTFFGPVISKNQVTPSAI